VTFTKNFGDQQELYSGFDINVNARLRGGAFLQGGVSIGRTSTNNCYAKDLPQLAIGGPRTDAYCDTDPPLSAGSQVKFAGTYKLPWAISVAATYQNTPGNQILA